MNVAYDAQLAEHLLVRYMQMTSVMVFTALFPPAVKGGGPIRSVEAVVSSHPKEFTPFVVTSDRDLHEAVPLGVDRNQWTKYEGVSVRYTTLASPVQLFRGLLAARSVQPEILYFNSFFTPALTILPLLLWRVGFWGKPLLLLAPRGEFGGGALSRRGRKKQLYIRLFRFLRLHRSVMWHATARHEVDDLRRVWGNDIEVILREDQALLPSEPAAPNDFHGEMPRLIFLGRIVEHKGPFIALEALRHCSKPISLDIFGPSEDRAYAAKCEYIAGKLPPHIDVKFKGLLEPHEVRSQLALYDAMLMPTAGENFGHVIAEALSVSCPVITTPLTPWTELLSGGGGIIVPDRSPTRWAEAINEFTQLDAHERHAFRLSAADCYRRWCARPSTPHVWVLAVDANQRVHTD
nr:glycosyltransferase [Paenarthrobacter ureafaciens]MCY0975606.1 glycosyltransferase [Paenarthrobacter ureafaciens]